MRKGFLVLILLGLFIAAVPMTALALGLEIEAKAGGGLALGTTSNPNSTGAARGELAAGLDLDLYLLSLGPVDLGISAGGEYSYLTFHGVTTYTVPISTTQTSDSTYNYLNIPIALVARIPLSDALRMTFRAGGFIGYFLGGSSNLNYSTTFPPYFVNGTVTLDSTTTVQWEYGLHLTGGVDIRLGGNFFLSPSLTFDMGLTNTTNTPGYQYSDTFWSLSALIGIKYTAM